MENERAIMSLISRLTDNSLMMSKELKVVSEGLAETMRQVIELKERIEKLEVKK